MGRASRFTLDGGAAEFASNAERGHEECLVRSFGLFALISIAALFASSGSQAGACGARADQDNPMAWDEGFGVSHCARHKPRYHTSDYEGEGARGYATSSDPMAWSGTQWGITLFDGYARTYDSRYDRRVRREPAHSARAQVAIDRRIEITVREGASEELAEPAKPRGPKFTNLRTASDFKTNTGVLRFGGHDCRGVLVLTWGSLGSKSRCHSSEGRIKAP